MKMFRVAALSATAIVVGCAERPPLRESAAAAREASAIAEAVAEAADLGVLCRIAAQRMAGRYIAVRRAVRAGDNPLEDEERQAREWRLLGCPDAAVPAIAFGSSLAARRLSRDDAALIDG